MTTVRKPPLTDKSVQRGLYREKRRVLLADPGRKSDLDREIQSRLILSSAYRDADALLLYAAREDEIATDMILFAALSNHKTVAFPRCGEKGEMRFYIVDSPSRLIPGRFGIREPDPSCTPFRPDSRTLCVCPCLCCDMEGFRLGAGGGYYDRFLSSFEGVSAALCYADAMLTELYREPHDVPVNAVFTEQYVRVINAR